MNGVVVYLEVEGDILVLDSFISISEGKARRRDL